MSFKKIPNGDYYYFNKTGNTVMMVKARKKPRECGFILNLMLCPKELTGKRVRLKLEIVE